VSSILKAFAAITATVALCISTSGQKVDFYIHDLSEALVPYGTVKISACHNLMLELHGPWGNFAIPDGNDKDHTGQLTWTVIKVDVSQIWIDLALLDEDKVQNFKLFSLEYLSKHEKGTPYVADTPAVMISTTGLNNQMTVNTIDPDKVHALRGQTHVTDAQMGLSIDDRKYAFLLFADQQHADAFQKAIQKAIVVCKAQ
jgi:hypothetical protein